MVIFMEMDKEGEIIRMVKLIYLPYKIFEGYIRPASKAYDII